MQPVMLFNPGKISSTSRLLFERGIAMVVVGFPATPLLSARARICISASHSREDLDWALQVGVITSAHAFAGLHDLGASPLHAPSTVYGQPLCHSRSALACAC